MIHYIENPKDATKKLSELRNEFSKVAGYIIHKNLYIFTLRMKYQKRNFKQLCLKLHQKIKNKIPRNKLNQRSQRTVKQCLKKKKKKKTVGNSRNGKILLEELILLKWPYFPE